MNHLMSPLIQRAADAPAIKPAVSDALKTWTVLTTILGLAGFALTFIAWILVGGLGA